MSICMGSIKSLCFCYGKIVRFLMIFECVSRKITNYSYSKIFMSPPPSCFIETDLKICNNFPCINYIKFDIGKSMKSIIGQNMELIY